MKTIVFAYNDIGCIGIKALQKAGFEIKAVFTHIDDPKENKFFSSVARLVADLKIPIFAPENINHSIWIDKVQKIAPDVIFSFYYRYILSKKILDLAPKGAFNLHSSLLPKYRGRAPINWAILNGETKTGITLHKMSDKNVDNGDIIVQKSVVIDATDTALILHKKICNMAEHLLDQTLPLIKNNEYLVTPQDNSQATYFGRRMLEDGLINWAQSAIEVNNLIRAITEPYPGAFTYIASQKIIIWSSRIIKKSHNKLPGTVISINPFQIACGQDAIEVITGQKCNTGLYLEGSLLAKEIGIVTNMQIGIRTKINTNCYKRILIIGVNGFIGNHLTERLLENGNYDVYGVDISSSAVSRFIINSKNISDINQTQNKRFHFFEGDISIHNELIEYLIKTCDIIIPLVAIAIPNEYIRNPIKVFELNFEDNLKIIRYCVKYNKRIIFPSTSEVYGMCNDRQFDEENSNFIVGPINKHRWIYSVSKQLLDRIIWAYSLQNQLKFTIFRPFNWIGPRLDSLHSARIGSARAITKFILNLVEGSPIQLVNGGNQKRCFTHIRDGIEALFRIIENKDDKCNRKIINIGNPTHEVSIAQLANMLLDSFEKHKLRHLFPPFAGFNNIESINYYGEGYQDIQYRRPSIENARYLLKWNPTIDMQSTIEDTLDFFLHTATET